MGYPTITLTDFYNHNINEMIDQGKCRVYYNHDNCQSLQDMMVVDKIVFYENFDTKPIGDIYSGNIIVGKYVDRNKRDFVLLLLKKVGYEYYLVDGEGNNYGSAI